MTGTISFHEQLGNRKTQLKNITPRNFFHYCCVIILLYEVQNYNVVNLKYDKLDLS